MLGCSVGGCLVATSQIEKCLADRYGSHTAIAGRNSSYLHAKHLDGHRCDCCYFYAHSLARQDASGRRWRIGRMHFGDRLIVGPNLVAFKREYSEAETRESTYMRAAFAYVSWQMFLDRPIEGFWFQSIPSLQSPLSGRSHDQYPSGIDSRLCAPQFLSKHHRGSWLDRSVLYGLTTFAFPPRFVPALVQPNRSSMGSCNGQSGIQCYRGTCHSNGVSRSLLFDN